ncbi:MAG: anti-sigma factor family protein [Gemmatimonadota bacterium]
MTDAAPIGCASAAALLPVHAAGELEAAQRLQLERHLLLCPACRDRLSFERELRTRLHELARRPVPAGLEERVRRSLAAAGRSARSQRHHRGAGPGASG